MLGEGNLENEMSVTKELIAIDEALLLIFKYGGIGGAHHKQWVLDQVVRALTGDGYAAWVAEARAGEDGPDTYDLDEGIAP